MLIGVRELLVAVMMLTGHAESTSPLVIGDTCADDWNCLNNLHCVTTTCACAFAFYYVAYSPGPCYRGVMGDMCATDIQCYANLLCNPTTSKCECSTGYTWTGTECVLRSTIDGGQCDLCTSDAQCGMNGECVGLSECVTEGVCACITGFVDVQGTCTSSGTLCSGCTLDQECTVTNSECGDDGTCVCVAGYFQSSAGTCTTSGGFGEDTQNWSQNQLDDWSFSSKQVNQGFLWTLNLVTWNQFDCSIPGASGEVTSRTRGFLAEGCVDINDCTYSGSTCLGTPGLCTCEDGSYSISECFSGALGDICDPALTQCLDANSVCNGVAPDYGMCECVTGYNPVGSVCSEGLLGDVCTTPYDCDSPNAICAGQPAVCTCAGYIIGGACFTGALGDDCATTGQCTVTGSDCIDSTCICVYPYYTYGSVCRTGESDDK